MLTDQIVANDLAPGLLLTASLNQNDLRAGKDVVPPTQHSPPDTQDTAGVPPSPNPAGSSTSTSLALTAPHVPSTRSSVISASQEADPGTFIPSSAAPEIPINPSTPTSTADLPPSSIAQPGSNSTGPPSHHSLTASAVMYFKEEAGEMP
ncbi:hypothetical protein PtB15_18B430 [Puccinia triticina]|nr:hypothetical protein PtB15_18B430 [Puccinia triticina]